MPVAQPSALQVFFDSPFAKRARFNLSASAGEPFTYDELLALEDGVAEGLFSTTLVASCSEALTKPAEASARMRSMWRCRSS